MRGTIKKIYNTQAKRKQGHSLKVLKNYVHCCASGSDKPDGECWNAIPNNVSECNLRWSKTVVYNYRQRYTRYC